MATASEAEIKVLHVLGGGIRCGVGAHVFTLARGFAGTEIRVILTLLLDGPLAQDAANQGIDVRVIGKRFTCDPAVFWKIRALIRRERVDIVHTHTINSNFYGRWAAKLARSPKVVSTVHTFGEIVQDTHRSVLAQRAIWRQDLFGAQLCSRLIAVSERLRNAMIREGVEEGKVVTIPNGIDLAQYDPSRYDSFSIREGLRLSPGEALIGTAGRLVPLKNQQLFLQAAQQLLQRGIRARFLILGDGPLREELVRQAEELGIEGKVIFSGWQIDPIPLLAALDVFVLPSISEANPLTIMQALALKRPVVATAVGGVPEIVEDGQSGLLLPSGDLPGLVESIAALLRDRGRARVMGEAGRLRVMEQFTEQQLIARTRAVYDTLVRNGGSEV